MRTRGLLPVLLFLAAAGGVAFLGARIIDSERASAERTARERLRARAQEAAGILVAAASRAIRESAAPEYQASVTEQGLHFASPQEPRPLRRRAPPNRDLHSEEAFYLDLGEQAEARKGDIDEAAKFYRKAAGPGMAAMEQATALYRLAAIERRRGAVADARAAEGDFLAKCGPWGRDSLEAFIVRSRATPPDNRLQADLLDRLGSGEDLVVLGILEDAGLLDAAAIGRRREELRLMNWLRPVLPSMHAAGTEARILDGQIVAWTAAPIRTDDPHSVGTILPGATLAIRVDPLPTLPEGTVLGESAPPPAGDEYSETVGIGDPLDRSVVTARVSRAVVEEAAVRGAWTLGGVLTSLLLAGGAAFVLAVRASRRETEAARARGDFVTKVGHDLRTPLSVIRMYAETLAAGRVADPAQAREFASVAAREAERLTGMVGQVLDLSRVAEGDGALARKPLDLAALAREVAEFHRPLFAQAGVRLTVEAAGPLPVTGDSAALRGAVSNLLDNALRHGSAGGEVAVEARVRGRMAEVRVLDRGPGIPAGMEERLFERFVRGPGATGHGAGLGLALVREAAQAHGGAARASNREGGGVEFTLELPMEEAS